MQKYLHSLQNSILVQPPKTKVKLYNFKKNVEKNSLESNAQIYRSKRNGATLNYVAWRCQLHMKKISRT